MPKVPQYQRQIISTNMPDVRAQAPDASAYGGSVGAAMGQFGQAIVRAGDEVNNQLVEQQQKINTQKVLDTATKFETDVLLKDFNNGYFTVKGQDAFGIEKDANKHLDNKLNEYLGTFDNDVQRLAFKQYMAKQVTSYRELISNHVRKQVDDATEQSILAQADSGKRMAVSLRNNPDAFQTSIEKGFQAVEHGLRMRGTPADVIANKRFQYGADVIKDAILADINEGDLDGAQKKMQMYRDKLDPTVKSALDGKIRPAIEKVTIDKEANALLDKHGGDVNAALAAIKQGNAGSNQYMELAKQVSAKTGIPADIIYGQWYHETGGFSNWGTKSANNFGGMKQFRDQPAWFKGDAKSPEGDNYQVFESPQAYADYYAQYINKYIPELKNAKTPEEVAATLKKAGYYTSDDVQGYAAGIRNGMANTSGFASQEYNMELEKRVMQVYSTREQLKSYAEEKAQKNVLDALAQLGPNATIDDKIAIVDKAQGLPPRVSANLKDQILTRTKSEDSATAALERLAAQERLSVDDVENMSKYLSHPDYLRYRNIAINIKYGSNDKELAAIDRQWHPYLDNAIKDEKKRTQYLVDIKSMLSGLKGQERLTAAYGLIDKAAKNESGIFGYTKNNNLERQQLVNVYGNGDPKRGEKLITLIEQGLSTDKYRSKWGGSYGMISSWLATLGAQRAAGDTAIDATLTYLLDNNMAINPDSFDITYRRFASKSYQGALPNTMIDPGDTASLRNTGNYDPYYVQRGGTY